jgi:hypothetical protein
MDGDGDEASPPKLALLLGSPRSGTTYLAKLLDRHPAVGYLHEPLSKGSRLLIHKAIGMACRGESLDAALRKDLILDLVQHFPCFAKPPSYRKDFERLRFIVASGWWLHYLWKVHPGYVQRYLDLRNLKLLLLKDGLAPFSYELCQALDARMIVLLRHPCGVVNSMLRGEQIGAMNPIHADQLWARAQSLLAAWGYTQADLQGMQRDELHALRWLIDNHHVLAWLDDPAVKVVVYRDVVQEPWRICAELLPWLDLPTDSVTLSRMQRRTFSLTEWARGLFGSRYRYYGIHARASELDRAWCRELPAEAIARILHVVRSFPLERFWPDH